VSARINHPYLSSDYVEARAYQLKALNSILNSSTLLVLPTAMGKTPIEFMAIAERLLQFPAKKALLIAPTNPLLAQHFSDAKKFLNIQPENIVMINGGIHWKKREEIVKNAKLILATPQVIRNDVKRGSLSLSEYCLLVIDEAHHASGKHAMAEVADQYLESANSGLLLGATASPGSTEKAIINLTNRLDSKSIFSMQRSNPLIKPYSIELESKVINLDLPVKIEEMIEPLKKWLDGMVETLQRTGVYLQKGIVTRTGLNDAMKRANYLIERKSQHGWNSIKIIVDAIRVLQLINLISTQGIISTRNYMRRTESQFQKGEKKLSRFIQKKEFIDLKNKIYNMKEIHNKMDKVKELVKEQIDLNPNSRIIVFASLRDSVRSISISLNGINGVNAIPFVGQSSREGDDGMTQKQQISTLNKFREGELNVLVATSVGEEGLDIPSADRVVFYEPVASEIRTIQRRGRTGRHKDGHVYILVSKNTRDEGIRHAAVAKEIRMHRILNRVKSQRNLSYNYKNPINKLNNFIVSIHENKYDVESYIRSEEERLKEISKKDTVINSEENKNKSENKMRELSNNLSISQKLRPLGQTGLEQFNLKSEEE